ncbi:MAG: sulfite exporter TauE/SafE family protein [Ruminococcaceae bacterium]|nr:sulfite exporter TauE/SafE family protein [Oscillospiraceae bacterium]
MIIVNMLCAALIAVMAGLGIGGGGLLVIYLTSVLSIDQLSAQGINLVFFIFSAAASLFIHFRKRNIDIIQVAILSVSGICASLLGSHISHNIKTHTLSMIFGMLLILSGLVTLLKSKKKG